jgi:transposase
MSDEIRRDGRGKRYAPEFKQSAIELAISGEKPILKIAEDLGISSKTMYGWVSKYRMEHDTTEQKDETLTQINKRLLKENALLRKEKEILKKATAYFAKETL